MKCRTGEYANTSTSFSVLLTANYGTNHRPIGRLTHPCVGVEQNASRLRNLFASMPLPRKSVILQCKNRVVAAGPVRSPPRASLPLITYSTSEKSLATEPFFFQQSKRKRSLAKTRHVSNGNPACASLSSTRELSKRFLLQQLQNRVTSSL